MSTDRLAVLLHGTHIAWLERGEGRAGARLRYEPETSATARLSVSMPSRARAYPASAAEPWLQGLLPDDPRVLRRWADDFRLPDTTAFALLGSPVGADCAGAVQFCQPDAVDMLRSRGGATTPLDDVSLRRIMRDLHEQGSAWLGDPASLQFSLSGGETKTALHHDGHRWCKSSGDVPSTHILKPELREARFDDLPVNEHLCQDTARRLGLNAARTELSDFDGITTLIVERYDRVRDQSGRLRRVHQEDFCQALTVSPRFKYERQGGPSLGDMADLLRKHSSHAQEDIRRLRDAIIFNWLVAGSDAHAKNYSLLHSYDGEIRLAPLYDTASGLPYVEKASDTAAIRLAQRIGRGYTLRRADRRSAWERAAAVLGLPVDETLDAASDMARRLPFALDAACADLPAALADSPTVDTLRARVHRRASRCRGVRTMGAAHNSQSASGDPQFLDRPAVFSSVICGQPISGRKTCQRRLVNAPCPIKGHGNSPGSRTVRARRCGQRRRQRH